MAEGVRSGYFNENGNAYERLVKVYHVRHRVENFDPCPDSDEGGPVDYGDALMQSSIQDVIDVTEDLLEKRRKEIII